MAPEDRRPLLCFVHIEKAAGMTVHAIFRNNWPLGYLTLTPFYLWSNEPGHELGPRECRALLRMLPNIRGLGGHTVRSYLGYETCIGRPVNYITWLREPIRRYLSQYNYQRHVMKKNWTIQSFLAEDRFANFMTMRLAGEWNVSRAKEEVERRFAFVGLLERFDESLLLMRSRLGLKGFDLRYEKENRSQDRTSSRDEELERDEIREQIAKRNALDVELYEYVRTRVFACQCSSYQGDLAADAEALSQTRREYRFPAARRLLWNMYRQLLYRHVENVVHKRFAGEWRRGRQAGPPNESVNYG